ncbi:MAG: cation:proton antiporter [Candidatus Bipolaricaulaceae bacterium]
MDTLLAVGVLLGAGLVLGETAERLGFPRVTGYILAGVLLNPSLFGLLPAALVENADLAVNVALALITFEVGGTLAVGPLRELGKGIVSIAVGEGQLAALVVTGGSLAVLPFVVGLPGEGLVAAYLPLALLLGALASPTDPTASLAVIHQYRARGVVSFSIMGAAAFDDALGIINFSVAVAVAGLLAGRSVPQLSSFLYPLGLIAGSLILGAAFGLAFHLVARLVGRESDGLLIALAVTLLILCFGIAARLSLDQLLATMCTGAVVVNLRRNRPRIFHLIERHVEPLVFLLFFTLSGLYLDFSVLVRYLPVVLLFVAFRTAGKLGGAYLGASAAHAPPAMRRYTGLGLIPQGGIVIGLALTVRNVPALIPLSDVLLSVIIGATVIHELVGPFAAKLALQSAGEIGRRPPR